MRKYLIRFVFVTFGAGGALIGPANAALNTTNFTTSFAEIDTTIDTPVTQQVNSFSTELIARMQGGPSLYDQIFNVPLADPAFQSALGGAGVVLTANGAVTILGPSLLSSIDTLGSNTQTVQTGKTLAATSVVGTQYVGPQSVLVGDFGTCQSDNAAISGGAGLSGCSLPGSLFQLLAGQTDFDTFVLTQFDILTTTTTTNSDLLTQVYELDGVRATTAVPEPITLSLFSAGLAGAVALRRRKKAKQA
jgi:PEP-CTERM motif